MAEKLPIGKGDKNISIHSPSPGFKVTRKPINLAPGGFPRMVS
jgi:hypothetical protein